jgi:hypothetical protein
MAKYKKQVVESPDNLVIDTAKLLQFSGVCQICESALDVAIHSIIKAQELVDFAAELFIRRRKQGLITFEQLMSELKNDN